MARTFAVIEQELKEANEALTAAHKAEAKANHERCNAVNRVNNLQKEFDALLHSMLRNAPRDSDWHNTHVRGKGNPA